MPISWNEIRHNAIRFGHEWAGAKSEAAEKQTFWNEFFEVFGLKRRVVATFEERVKNLSGDYDYIDLFWPGMLVVEHKSFGKDLGKAGSQAIRYIQELLSAGRHDEVPRYIIVSDFARIALHDLEPEDQLALPLLGRVKTFEFPLADFHRHIQDFAFIPGYKQHKFEDQDPINLKAVGILGNLHDTLEFGGYTGHKLERFLVRILFCLFAEDTAIFEREAFHIYIEEHTKPDGSDLGQHLAVLFEVLNTPQGQRQTNLDEDLAAFRYVNGELFAEQLRFAAFNRDMRDALIAATRFDWSQISPAIFGSLFQAVMEPRQRRQIGGHYTSERDILKVIRPLFLDDLREEFQRIGKSKAELRRFHKKLAGLRFLDPACGCGNFLVITYRELRLLEIEVLKALYGKEKALDIQHLSMVDVDTFYGIEINEWPGRIAEVAMWLMDHQMNIRLSEAFGQYFVRFPLEKSPTIVCGNALRLDWKQVLPPKECSYVLGNPPFVGKKERNESQKADMDFVWSDVPNAGILDYVTAWYRKAAEYLQGTSIRVGFVSTNSISQGEQVSVLWGSLLARFRLKIHFAHRTFQWESEARGKAHVHVVIIGFGLGEVSAKRLYDYDSDPQSPTVSVVRNISPYLIEGGDTVVTSRSKPLTNVPEIMEGSALIDDGHLLLVETEAADLREQWPVARKWLRPFYSGDEFINGKPRWCLWLAEADPRELRECAPVLDRVERVRAFRAKSERAATKKLAQTPTLFGELRQPRNRYLFVPKTSSERRRFVPIGFMPPKAIINNTSLFVDGATLYHFGILSSTMHMAWMRQVCGRLETRYRYSNKIVYNNYPWPESPSEKQRAAVEAAGQAVLDVRAEFQTHGESLAELYDPLAMPPKLVRVHADLDRAVDRCYRDQPFSDERQRVEFLFALYEKLTAPLIPAARKRRRR